MVFSTSNALSSDALSARALSTDWLSENVRYIEKLWIKSWST